MANETITLGRLKSDAWTFADGELIQITKHSWDCNWYGGWGFGYLGNKNSHFHFSSLLKEPQLCSELFDEPRYTDANWWIIRDLFVQAYALSQAAAVYKHGGHQTTKEGVTDILKSPKMHALLNTDLQTVLDTAWEALKTLKIEGGK